MAATNIPLRSLYVFLCTPMIILFHSLTRFYVLEKSKAALAIKNRKEVHRLCNNNSPSTNEDKKEVPLKGRKPAVSAENNHPGNGVEAEGEKIDREVAEMNAKLVFEFVNFLLVICMSFKF